MRGAGLERLGAAAWALLCAIAWSRPSAAQEDLPAPCLSLGTRACVPNAQIPIPANGAIMIAAQPGSTIEVIVWNETLTAHKPGSLTMIDDGMWAWVPDDGFMVGKYSVEIHEDSEVQDTAQITVVEATERDWPELMSAASLSQVISNGLPSCCQLDTGGGLIDFACASLSETTYALLNPGLSSSSSPIDLNQYLYRYEVAGHDAEPAVLPWSMAAELPIYESSDEYCYEVVAIDLVTGQSHPYPDLAGRCVEHGALAPFGTVVTELADEALTSTICPIPPSDLSDRWCAVNATACQVRVQPRHCHYYDFTCEDGSYPGPGWQSLPPRQNARLSSLIDLVDALNEQLAEGEGTRDGGAASGHEGDEPTDDRDPGASTRARDEATGCTILRQHTQATLSHLIFGYVAALLWLGVRRRHR